MKLIKEFPKKISKIIIQLHKINNDKQKKSAFFFLKIYFLNLILKKKKKIFSQE
jgi:hypothetical protein